MRWLMALDTTGEQGSLALLRDGKVIDEVRLQSSEGFGAVVFDAIESMWARHKLTPEEIDCYAGATGPGSFTGVRTGLTIIKGLGEATGRPVVGVSNLRAMASFGTGALRGVLLDARRGEIFGAVYDAGLRCVRDEVVIRIADWVAGLPAGELEFVAQDFAPFTLPAGLKVVAPRALAAAAGQIAWNEFAAGRATDAAALDANYVRRADAELQWKEM